MWMSLVCSFVLAKDNVSAAAAAVCLSLTQSGALHQYYLNPAWSPVPQSPAVARPNGTGASLGELRRTGTTSLIGRLQNNPGPRHLTWKIHTHTHNKWDTNTWDQDLKFSVSTVCVLKFNKRSGKSLLTGLAEPWMEINETDNRF